MVATSPVVCSVEPSHELAVGSAGGGELAVAFFELDAQIGDLLFQAGDRVIESIDAGGCAEPGFPPGLLAERLGQALFELLGAGSEPEGAFVGGGQVCLQRGPGDGRPGAFAGGGRAGFDGVDLAEQVAVPVEESAVDGGFSELGRCARNCLVRAYLWPPASLMALVTR